MHITIDRCFTRTGNHRYNCHIDNISDLETIIYNKIRNMEADEEITIINPLSYGYFWEYIDITKHVDYCENYKSYTIDIMEDSYTVFNFLEAVEYVLEFLKPEIACNLEHYKKAAFDKYTEYVNSQDNIRYFDGEFELLSLKGYMYKWEMFDDGNGTNHDEYIDAIVNNIYTSDAFYAVIDDMEFVLDWDI